MTIAFDNSYARLPPRFFVRQAPAAVPEPKLVRLNTELAIELGLDPDYLASPDGVAMLAGNLVADGSEPLAMAYAGHQFGGWSPQLGDGRALLLGEVIDKKGQRRDIQLKGSGRTPFSRMGDGRAVLGPVLREYMISEAMAALGIKTTRALAAVTTGQQIARTELLPGAIFTRVATSHIRIGTFEFFAGRRDAEGLKQLADYVIDRHYPEARSADAPYAALLEAVIGRIADLIASWQSIGFIHGVMNTDNMSIVGETIDYGPCAFMDTYDPATVYSSIDHMGRYAFGNQPEVAHWNLSRLAISLLPVLDDNQERAIELAQSALDRFPARFREAYATRMRAKLGLATEEDGDLALSQDLLDRMAEGKADFTLTFRRLSDLALGGDAEKLRQLFQNPASFDEWAVIWRERLARDTGEAIPLMHSANPAFIPRNHRVQAVIAAAEGAGDFAPLDTLLTVLAKPYEDQPEFASFAEPPQPGEEVTATFCGT
jgi:uncharacterized protein YdiU (UPF0061 family)